MKLLEKKIVDWIEENKGRFIDIGNKIWNFAEIGLLEKKSSALLAYFLKENGFKVKRGVAGMPTAFIATYGEGGPIIGILGEFDALPGLSQVAEPYQSPLDAGKPGHGCGHNLYGAACLAACLAIKKVLVQGKIKGIIGKVNKNPYESPLPEGAKPPIKYFKDLYNL